jgi:hypothetical protein
MPTVVMFLFLASLADKPPPLARGNHQALMFDNMAGIIEDLQDVQS